MGKMNDQMTGILSIILINVCILIGAVLGYVLTISFQKRESPHSIDYFVSYTWSAKPGKFGSGMASYTMDQPIRDMNDVMTIRDAIRKSTFKGFNDPNIVLLSWRRFE